MNKYIYYFNDGARLSEFRDDGFAKNEEYIYAFSTDFKLTSKEVNTLTGGWVYTLVEVD